MPSAAIVATQLTDRTTRAYTLTVGGVDILGAFAGAPFMVPIESIDVTENGPGDVSDMRFDIWDPSSLVTITEMAEVYFHDVTNDIPLFRGFVQSWAPSTEGIGRSIHVDCVGVEAALDWMLVPSLTIASGTEIVAAIQAAVANSTGGIPLRAFGGGGVTGNQAGPIGDLTNNKAPIQVTTSDAVVLAGDTVREAIRRLLDTAGFIDPTHGSGNVYGVCTVDFTYGLRVWKLGVGALRDPSDYAGLTVTDAVSGTAATVLSHETNSLATPRGVYVKGGNANGTGLVPDGTGIPGPIAFIDDSSITTSTAKDSAGLAYLERQTVTSVSGSLQVDGFAPTTNIRAGSLLTLTNGQLGLSGDLFTISSISKSFYATKQSWRVNYGRLKTTAMRQIRRLTRTTRA